VVAIVGNKGCNRKIVGQFIIVKGRKFHQQCAPEVGKCVRCEQVIVGEVKEIGDKCYHANCFNCYTCKAKLDVNCEVVKGGLRCPKCAKQLREAIASKQEIEGTVRVIREEDLGAATMKKELYQNIQQGKEICATCGKLVVCSVGVALHGKLYHAECFHCGKCGGMIGFESFIERSGTVFCQGCEKSFSLRELCIGCGNPLQSAYTVSAKGKYHPECFKCDGCRAVLKAEYSEYNDKTYCKSCIWKVKLRKN